MKMYLTIRSSIKLFHRVKNLVSQFLDPDFNTFKDFGFKAVPTDQLNDLRKLRYVRDLKLAESGFVNTALKEQLALLKSRDRLFQKDRNIVPVGRISVHENENKLMTLLLGFNRVENRTYMSYTHVNNCPVWHNYAIPLLKEKVQHLYPSRSDHLFIKHRYFQRDVDHLDIQTKNRLLHLFNDTLRNIYSYNRHLQNGIRPMVPPVGKLPKLSKTSPIQIEQGLEGLFVPATQGKNVVTLVPYLKVANEKNRRYLSVREFRSLLERKSITHLAETKYGVSLGIHGNRLYLKAANSAVGSDALKEWTLLDEFLESKNAPKRLKYEVVKNLIEKKDFLIHLDEIPLRQTNDTLLLKEHYGSGKTFFALSKNDKKPELKEYRPIAGLKNRYPEYYHSYREYMNRTDSLEPSGAKEKRGIKISI
ncbi:hypothetical protein [Pseudozobellia sp. WGM2]|uniref:hypothetical protein n=1 Tax=Pseudozobellia sp. WGM2 TaxID=2787625 RepID=UPI001ADEFF46|nr:hypothetical protein [Pseudozobellia sp. WGM2]